MITGIIGIGNMGSTIVHCLLKAGADPHSLFITDKDIEKLHILPVSQHSSIENIAHTCNMIVIAVKPQDFHTLASVFANHLNSNAWIVSIMAGIDTATLSHVCKTKNIVRCMPNLPSRICQGMTVWTSSHYPILDDIKALFAALGDYMQVESDDLVDKATALSGSGPGYVYYVEEQFIAAGERLGFTHEQSVRLVQATFCGALALQEQQNISPHELRMNVTSKGGTTAAAIELLDQCDMQKIVSQAVQRAYERAQEMKQDIVKQTL